MSVGVVTDSIACLPERVAAELRVPFASIHLIMDGEDYRDGVDISTTEFYARLGDTINHSTAAPSPGEFVEAMRASLASGADEILVVTLSARLSATHEAAVKAAELMPVPVAVVDSRTAAAAEGLLVRRLAELAAEGAPLGELVARAEAIRGRYHLQAVLAGLARLAHSGRMPRPMARIGDTLHVKPLISLAPDGSTHAAGFAQGLDRGVEQVYSRVLHALPVGVPARAVVTHALLPERAADLVARLRADRPEVEVDQVLFTPVMGASTGPIVGIAWEDPQQ
jgi:DegV family protein with EDD domain